MQDKFTVVSSPKFINDLYNSLIYWEREGIKPVLVALACLGDDVEKSFVCLSQIELPLDVLLGITKVIEEHMQKEPEPA